MMNLAGMEFIKSTSETILDHLTLCLCLLLICKKTFCKCLTDSLRLSLNEHPQCIYSGDDLVIVGTCWF